MRTAYFDCFSGISGDMVLGALLDAGLDFAAWRREVEKLGLGGLSVTRRKVKRGGISGTRLSVNAPPGQLHRNLPDIVALLRKSGISATASKTAVRIFTRLAKAEAKAHGVGAGKVHFHEVGAVDSIVDIAGSAIALEMLGVGRVLSSPLNLGSGKVEFSHGTFPVPAPATANLVKGVPAYASAAGFELTTPTGAAIITTLAEGFGPMPLMAAEATGYGAGSKDPPGMPNLLRVVIGEAGAGSGQDTVELIETNIDDMDPRLYEHVMERLFEAGAKDVWLSGIVMKKSRPGTKLSILAETSDTDRLAGIILAETTTFGVRITGARRQKLYREIREVKTRYGTVRVKVGMAGGKVVKAVPEYEDVKAAAVKSGRTAREIIREVERRFEE